MDILAIILLAVTAFTVMFIGFSLRAVLLELRRLERTLAKLAASRLSGSDLTEAR